MHTRHNRKIVINKAQLIEKIKENKINHIKDYEEAVITYKEEANKQLLQARKELEEGSLSIEIRLTTPINCAHEYDKVIEMFNWEVAEQVELTQAEFNEYINDESSFSNDAKFANSYYRSLK